MGETVGQLKTLTAETAFLIRTFFFVIFGYSRDLAQLNDLEVFTIGTGVVVGLLFVRYLYLRLTCSPRSSRNSSCSPAAW